MRSDTSSSAKTTSMLIKILNFVWLYFRSFFILLVFLWMGNQVSTWIPITIPGSILGLIFLFLTLSFQLLPAHWVQPGCSLFMRYMTLLFIPAAMGIMKYYPLLLAHFVQIMVSCLLSSAIVLIFVGKLTEYLHSDKKAEDK